MKLLAKKFKNKREQKFTVTGKQNINEQMGFFFLLTTQNICNGMHTQKNCISIKINFHVLKKCMSFLTLLNQDRCMILNYILRDQDKIR